MTKRTFVLFLSLVQILALTLFPQQSSVACKLDLSSGNFSPYAVQSCESQLNLVLTDDTICEEETIVQADDFEWKENLSSLLRHRNSTYRFLTTVSPTITEFYITQVPRLLRESVLLPAVNSDDIVTPGYYTFLHRLCPF
jgi:hypothetical protein